MDQRNPFETRAGEWMAVLGRLRDVVRQEVLRTQLASLAGSLRRPLRVLDAGCGQGTQALHLARAGHEVTGLDTSPRLLEAFATALAAEPPEVRDRVRLVTGPGEEAPRLAPGPFDLVLCHGVLMYLSDIRPMAAALAGVADRHGALSFLVRNGLALAMRDGLRGRWRDALDSFGTTRYVNRLGLPATAHTPDDLDRVLGPLGWQRERWYGVRVFTDHRDEPAPPPAELGLLLAAEREAAGRDPYRQVAALLHVIYRMPSAGPPAEADLAG
jgi:SAM-dependent methyltransferase